MVAKQTNRRACYTEMRRVGREKGMCPQNNTEELTSSPWVDLLKLPQVAPSLWPQSDITALSSEVREEILQRIAATCRQRESRASIISINL